MLDGDREPTTPTPSPRVWMLPGAIPPNHFAAHKLELPLLALGPVRTPVSVTSRLGSAVIAFKSGLGEVPARAYFTGTPSG